MPVVTTVDGSVWAISGPTVIPVAARGASSTARPARGYFLETHGTLFHGKHAAVELIVRVLACLAEDFLPFVNPNVSIFYPICTTGSQRIRLAS